MLLLLPLFIGIPMSFSLPENFTYHVTGIGNAIVDVLSTTDDETLRKLGLAKGHMILVSEAEAEQLYKALHDTQECSGGSVANSIAALAGLGSRTAFIGKVRDDVLGNVFREDMQAMGVHFTTPDTFTGLSTAYCMVLVTPDGQRTMNTYLGACNQIITDDIDEDIIAQTAVLFIEGYLWDEPPVKNAIRSAIQMAKQHHCRIALSLSDTFCVERHREDFKHLIMQDVDILFANEAEILSLLEVTALEETYDWLAQYCSIAALTRGALGSTIVCPEDVITVNACTSGKTVDTTGAGDLYAAGFLHGLTHGKSLKECSTLASRCGGHIVTQFGARSKTSLQKIA
jgi:sugar/nucleoside kinase (ribokinase family)